MYNKPNTHMCCNQRGTTSRPLQRAVPCVRTSRRGGKRPPVCTHQPPRRQAVCTHQPRCTHQPVCTVGRRRRGPAAAAGVYAPAAEDRTTSRSSLIARTSCAARARGTASKVLAEFSRLLVSHPSRLCFFVRVNPDAATLRTEPNAVPLVKRPRRAPFHHHSVAIVRHPVVDAAEGVVQVLCLLQDHAQASGAKISRRTANPCMCRLCRRLRCGR